MVLVFLILGHSFEAGNVCFLMLLQVHRHFAESIDGKRQTKQYIDIPRTGNISTDKDV